MYDAAEIVYETDLTPVLEALETLQQIQQAQFIQLHTDANLIFLAICGFAGVVLGCAVGVVICRMWGI